MTPTPKRLVLLAVLAFTSATPIPAFADGLPAAVTDNMPVTFAAGVRMIGDERDAIEASRAAGDFVGVAGHADRLAALSGVTRSLGETQSGVIGIPALEEIALAADSLLAVATELRDAADRRDVEQVRRASARAVGFCTLLESHVPNEYACPMHCEPGKVYSRPGSCPVCGMELQRITTDRYSVQVVPHPETIRAGQPTTLSFRIRDPFGFEVTDLKVVHEKLIHLIVVSHDLSWFAHVHPVLDDTGGFTLRFTFPAGGAYTLFHDFTPAQVGMQVVPVELFVEGEQRAPTALVLDDRVPKRIDGYDVKLTHTGLGPGLGCGFAFWISRRGKPVTDLEPFLGAMGHLVIVSEDRTVYIHSHPLDQPATTGPIVQFAMMFPKTGLYRSWGQFQHHGHVLTVPFVVEVTPDGHDHRPIPTAAH